MQHVRKEGCRLTTVVLDGLDKLLEQLWRSIVAERRGTATPPHNACMQTFLGELPRHGLADARAGSNHETDGGARVLCCLRQNSEIRCI